ncbi:MAG: bifunctional phosphoribosylaminoimidazolecarboxamide formyltransferase/IMP cyclohydrolase, partial [Candidatus Cloacimonas sp.]|nr:bifunctional phosphoribosylaminoimidazolecarboxamide formyltransferase/IMP cyclohydrolase [Candidatus Cloacimonas sp.]
MTKYALISVWDKSGIEHLAIELEKLGYAILSTSNTAKYLAKFCPSLVQVSEITGFPEILDGRVKTLHPVIQAGILADRSNPNHENTLAEHKIEHIDIVVVNLYPFAAVSKRENASHAQIIENIDIGGPTLIRAAAKNYAHVAVLTDPQDYPLALEQLKQSTCLNADFSRYLAQKAFAKVSAYDAGIAAYFAALSGERQIPQEITLSCPLQSPLRYGENPHQQAGFYANKHPGWQVLHGKELSFNNLLDIDAALKAIRL